MKKIRIFCLVLAVLLLGTAGLGCKPPKEKEYKFHAVGCDLSDYVATGYGGGDNGLAAIFGKHNMNLNDPSIKAVVDSTEIGYFIGAMVGEHQILIFNIESDEISKACSLTIRLSSEFGTVILSPETFVVEINDVALDYSSIELKGNDNNNFIPFKDYTFSVTFALNKGPNTIRLFPGDNIWGPHNASAGPAIDCIKIKSTVPLAWNSLWEQNKAEWGF